MQAKEGDNSVYEIPYLVSVPSHRDKGVEEALLSLILTYCANKGAKTVRVLAPPECLVETYDKSVYHKLTSAGF